MTSTAIIDRIGDDWRGELIVREYQAGGVDTRHLTLEKDHTSTYGSVLVRKRDGARHVVFSPGNFTPLSTGELPLDTIRAAKILHLNGRHWPACIDAALEIRKAGGQVSFDGGANRYDEKFNALLPLVDIHIAARDFAEKLSGTTDTGVQLAHMIGLGAKVAGITDGIRGSWFATADGTTFHQPTYPVENVVDTTGCGDAFHGAYLFGHSRGWEVHECATFASAAAALNATGLGGRGHLPELSEVRELIMGT
jgi:sulfofructose kinase